MATTGPMVQRPPLAPPLSRSEPTADEADPVGRVGHHDDAEHAQSHADCFFLDALPRLVVRDHLDERQSEEDDQDDDQRGLELVQEVDQTVLSLKPFWRGLERNVHSQKYCRKRQDGKANQSQPPLSQRFSHFCLSIAVLTTFCFTRR